MKNKWIRTAVSVCMAAALLIVSIPLTSAQTASPSSSVAAGAQGDAAAAVKNKTEVVYATLAPTGGVSSVYVVNQFEVTAAGSLTDYGSYSSVTNLTDTEALTQQGNAVSFHAGEGNFYYQGDAASTELPWNVGITYYLDGKEIAPDALAGQSGQLEIRVTTRQNASVDPAFWENYMLQIAMTLNNEKCSDIAAPGATVASAGKNTSVNFTVMPKKEANITLSATVRDFEMQGIQISGIPLSVSVDLSDTDDMMSDFGKLSDAIGNLNNGVGRLANGTKDLSKGASQLESGSADFRSGLAGQSENAGQLTQASAQINAALAQIAASMSGPSGGFSLKDMAQLPDGLSQIADGLTGVSGGMTLLKQSFVSTYAALTDAIGGIPGNTLTQAQIDALYEGADADTSAVLDTLVESYKAGQAVKTTFGQVKGAFDAVGTTLETLSGSIDSIAASLTATAQQINDALSGSDVEQLGQLADGLTTLAGEYATFNEGLASFMDGVKQLSTGYAAFQTGLTQFAGGVDDLSDGVNALHDGTTELHDETSSLPNDVQSQIDDLTAEYSGADFTPVSFMSPQNPNIALVQFVLKCGGIEKPDVVEEAPPEQADPTVWDRFTALFEGKKNS